MTVPETCAVLAIGGETGCTMRSIFAFFTLPPTRMGEGVAFGGGGGPPPTPPIIPPSTPLAEPPGTPPGTPPTTPTAPTSGGISSSLIMFTFFGMTVGAIILPCWINRATGLTILVTATAGGGGGGGGAGATRNV